MHTHTCALWVSAHCITIGMLILSCSHMALQHAWSFTHYHLWGQEVSNWFSLPKCAQVQLWRLYSVYHKPWLKSVFVKYSLWPKYFHYFSQVLSVRFELDRPRRHPFCGPLGLPWVWPDHCPATGLTAILPLKLSPGCIIYQNPFVKGFDHNNRLFWEFL